MVKRKSQKKRYYPRRQLVRILEGKTRKLSFSGEVLLASIAILMAIIVVIGTSYAVFTKVVSGTKTHSVVSGTFQTTFTEGNAIMLQNAYPMTDQEGLATTPYTFTVKNTGTVTASYRVKLEEDTAHPSRMVPRNKLKLSYKKGTASYTTPALLSSFSQELLLVSNQSLASGASASFELKMWIDYDAGNEVQGKEYRAKIVVEAVQATDYAYQDTIPPIIKLNGIDVVNVLKGSSYVESGVASVIDDMDGTISTSAVTKSYEYYNPVNQTTTKVSSVNVNNVGIYYITYQVNDSAGNIGLRVRTVNVHNVDSIPPKITLSGGTTVEISLGKSYVEPGYSATDAVDGTLTNRVVVIGTVNVNIVGSYVIKYLVTDQSGNVASVTRTVSVLDGTSPTCFAFSGGEITGYNCTAGNSLGLPTITDVEIPKAIGGVAVTSIGNMAFQGASLTSVVIPDGVTTIEQTAFMFNQLTSLELPDSVTTIGSTAFAYNQLTSLKLSNKLVTIEDSAFVSNKLTTVVLPESLKSIGINAFATNQLTGTITVPASVTTLADGVFAISSGSNSKLTKVINKTGRAFDWGKILMAHSDSIEIPPQNCITGTITNKAGYKVVVSAS